MSFVARHLGIASTVVTVAACAIYALLFYPRGIDHEAQLAHAAERDRGYQLLIDGITAHNLGDLSLARTKYEAAIAIDPGLYRVQFMLGQLELDEGNTAEAIERLDLSLSLAENQADALNTRGVARWRAGDRRGAIRDFNRALSLEPEFSRARTNRGLAQIFLGDNRKAQADFEASLEGRKRLLNAQRAVLGLGIIYALEGQYESALDSFSVIAAIPRAHGPLALYNRAKVHEAMGNTEAAQRDRDAYEAMLQQLENTDAASAAPDNEA